ncbi:MAG TPA: TetR/AcrR family transcriptional regulator [Steroidobacteraceae bacterium]|jgi:AcrR family transcriptional regulator|nr:TetR/AcrR family transcriptional regulator [Steroidobacteraceae bacterium]
MTKATAKSNPKSRPYHHGDLRRSLLDTARSMLQEDTGWQFTLREVARRAGVSHAAPYKHFADRGALLAEIAAAGFQTMEAAMRVAAERNAKSCEATLQAIARAVMDFGLANSGLYRLMYSAEVDKKAYPALEQAALSSFGVLLAALEQGQRAGVLRAGPVRGQAAACWALVHGLTTLQIDGQLTHDKVGSKPVTVALDYLMDGLKA